MHLNSIATSHRAQSIWELHRKVSTTGRSGTHALTLFDGLPSLRKFVNAHLFFSCDWRIHCAHLQASELVRYKCPAPHVPPAKSGEIVLYVAMRWSACETYPFNLPESKEIL